MGGCLIVQETSLSKRHDQNNGRFAVFCRFDWQKWCVISTFWQIDMIKLTDRDYEMIEVLKRDGRISVTDLANALGVSRSTVQKRLDRLETSGVIESYSCILAGTYQREWVRAHVTVNVETKTMDSVVRSLSRVGGVEEVHSVSGESDLIVVLTAPTVQALETAVDEVIAIEGVERTRTSIILSTRINRRL
jgi:DNA-binding Lrp family transcriptional regulator